MDLPSLFTTGGDQSSSDSSGEGRDRDIENLDILGPYGNELLVPTSELRDFVKTPFRLTREGRQQIQNLRSNPRRRARLEQNPGTPISSGPNPETPARSVTTQAESNTPIQPEKRDLYPNYLHLYHYLRTNLSLALQETMRLQNRNKRTLQFEIHNAQILHPRNLYTINLTKRM